MTRRWLTHLLALRSLTVEFGPAEVVDSLIVRPLLIYSAPLLLDHVLLGWIVGGAIADVAFYACTICSYERFKRLLIIRPRHEEVFGEPVATRAVA